MRNKLPDHLVIGELSELKAQKYLKSQGLKLVSRNFLCKMGEIDLIAMDRDILVFIEVRFRKNVLYGSGADTITHAKRRKIIRTADYFLQRHRQFANCACRFDIISISLDWKGETEITWIKEAFDVA